MILSLNTRIKDLLECEESAKVLNEKLPGLVKVAESNPQALTLSLSQLIKYARVNNGDAILNMIGREFDEINRTVKIVTKAEKEKMEFFKKVWDEEKTREERPETHHQDAIYPGQPWLDTKGERIQAHGAAVYYEDGVYYWYGENKEYTDGKNGIWTWGLKVYSSSDLYNWTDRGYLIPPNITDPDSSMFPSKRTDRPHIIKCDKTGKYVCWFKLSGAEAAFSIYQADSLLGKYEEVANLYNPNGYKIGDFDLIKDEDTKKAYIYFDGDHKSTVCMRLSDDYLKAEEVVCESYKDLKPPFTREAQSLFEFNGKKYMLTSSMSGYVPNKSDCAKADKWTDEFISIGDPHVNDESCASFNSQISKVFKVEGKKDLFIAMADRWLPEYHVDAELADVFVRAIASVYQPDKYQATDEEKARMYAGNKLETANTQIADYVWLPIQLNGPEGEVKISWSDSWNPADFD